MADDMAKLLASFSSQMSNVSQAKPASRGLCATCGKDIYGELSSALGKVYHVEHFTCSMCRLPMGDKEYYEHGDVVYCKPCFENKVCDQCAKCKGPIMDRLMEVSGFKYHESCFVCTHCNKSLDGIGFLMRDNQPYCEPHYHSSFAPKCRECKREIPGPGVLAFGAQFHFECFKCASCKKVLPEGRFWEFGGAPYCEPDYHAKSGGLCAQCVKPIAGGRVINALGKKWHTNCFRCEGCKRELLGISYAEVNGKAYCPPCDEKYNP